MRSINPPEVEVRHTGITEKGLGVYAARGFGHGEVVEVCPVLAYNSAQTPMVLGCYVIDWAALTGKDPGTRDALALGYGSLYNHSDFANLRWEALDPDELKKYLIFRATRDIRPGEELTINYDQDKKPGERSWFDVHQVKRLP